MVAMRAIRFGMRAVCRDGATGSVVAAIIDPGDRALTYLLIEPRHRLGLGRLVPMSMVSLDGRRLRLRTDADGFEQLDLGEAAQETEGVRTSYGTDQAARVTRVSVEVKAPRGQVCVGPEAIALAAGRPSGTVAGMGVTSDFRLSHILIKRKRRWLRTEVAVAVEDVAKFGPAIHLVSDMGRGGPDRSRL